MLIIQMMYKCNVLNCGNGKCIHKLLDEHCPYCNHKMVEVTTTGFKFCSNDFSVCDYEIEPGIKNDRASAPII